MSYFRGSRDTMRRRCPSLLAFAVAALLSGPATALDSDRQQPAQLVADRAEMNNATGVGIYTGNVVLTQGTLRMSADRMTVYTTPEGEIRRVVSEGDPATFRQLPEGQSEHVNARAPRMEYRLQAPASIDLTGGALLTQGKNQFAGEVVHYDVAKDVVTARGDGESQERIRITFFPKQDAKAAPAPQDQPPQ